MSSTHLGLMATSTKSAFCALCGLQDVSS